MQAAADRRERLKALKASTSNESEARNRSTSPSGQCVVSLLAINSLISPLTIVKGVLRRAVHTPLSEPFPEADAERESGGKRAFSFYRCALKDVCT